MECPRTKRVLSYALGEYHDEERKAFRDHVESCSECRELLKAFEATEQLLKMRTLPEAPAKLKRECLRRIDVEAKSRGNATAFRRLWNGLLWRPQPAGRIAVLVVVFCSGLGLGKLLFDQPSWLDRTRRMVQNGSMFETLDNNRVLRNYLLSVETHFLNLSNMENPVLIHREDWDAEMKFTQEILKRTRKMKEIVRHKNLELYQLVSEIEWVLEDVIRTPELELADLSKELRRDIDERRLIAKIHGFIS